jgi:hypothetical protein
MRNRIVLVDLEKALPLDQPLAFARLRDSYTLFRDLGVQAVLLPHDVPNNVAGWVDPGNARGTVLPLPIGDIGFEDSLLPRRHLLRGPVTIEAEWQNEVTGPVHVSKSRRRDRRTRVAARVGPCRRASGLLGSRHGRTR